MTSNGRRLMAGASWVYGLQLLTVVVQLGYAALTSRLAAPGVFGAYSVALSIAALVNLLGSGGLSQTAARAPDAERSSTRPLATYALLLGVAAALFTLVTADLWSAFWGAPQAAGAVRLLAVSALVMPFLSLSTGLLRRQGAFREMAIATFCSNVVGMVAGAGAVLLFPSPESLAVSAIIGQWGTLLWAATRLRGALVPGRLALRSDNVRFSTKLVAVSVFQYISGNAPRWSVSQFVGAGVLGAWNRADVLSTVPFSQLQNALMQVIYPEFRRYEVGRSDAKAVWLDMLTLVAWLTLPIGAVIAGVGPEVVHLALGPGWELAGQILPLLAVLGAVQPLMILLAGALESAALFKAIWLSEAVAFVISAVGVAMVVVHQQYVFALLALIAAMIGRHVVHIIQAQRVRALGFRQLALGYAQPAGFALVLYGSLVVLFHDFGVGPVRVAVGLIGLAALAAWVGLTRRSFPPLEILHRRGILGRRGEGAP
ncbi:oligosaccharide flippase family protein [Curtobacterium flaccumfaciens]|uniref:oligosaccharide flippase family protein n=1 Tax=Curtobacterium flaccumfaciens TaxID=2035 RepID=UPI00188BDFEA|nr:oligosaccharide flippase family protein [Curtobacterium flaccumfaciens]MBF4628102.1 oligosaccharide flippase family protein [Curtobacterium flaccumfaciens]